MLLKLFWQTSANFHEISDLFKVSYCWFDAKWSCTSESASVLIENRWNNFSWGADKRRLHFSPSILLRRADVEIRRPSSRTINKILRIRTHGCPAGRDPRNLSFAVDDGTVDWHCTSRIDTSKTENDCSFLSPHQALYISANVRLCDLENNLLE